MEIALEKFEILSAITKMKQLSNTAAEQTLIRAATSMHSAQFGSHSGAVVDELAKLEKVAKESDTLLSSLMQASIDCLQNYVDSMIAADEMLAVKMGEVQGNDS